MRAVAKRVGCGCCSARAGARTCARPDAGHELFKARVASAAATLPHLPLFKKFAQAGGPLAGVRPQRAGEPAGVRLAPPTGAPVRFAKV
eukprot:scaffold7382_cov406-Prasinococcus_capsulatus_cf.AAC.10